MRMIPLGKVSDINPRKPRDLNSNEECSFVPMELVDEHSGRIVDARIRPIGEVEKGYTYFADGDVLFAKITPCMENGKCAIASNLIGGVGFGSTEFHVLRASGSIIPEWIYYFLRQESVRQQAKRQMSGSAGQQRVPAGFLDKLEIPLPPLAEQQRIADILSRADRLRRLRRFALAMSEGYLQAVFLEMFGDPVTNPMGWPIVALNRLLKSKAQNGLYLSKDKYLPTGSSDGIEMVHMADLFYEIVERGRLKRVQIDKKDFQKYLVDHNDLLIARRSLNYEGSAKPCRIPISGEPLIFESSMIRITPDPSRVHPTYLFYYLANDRARSAHILKYVTRSTISGINQENLNRLEILVPPISAQENYVKIVRNTERLRAQQRESLRQAEHLFQTLLQRAFRGGVEKNEGNNYDSNEKVSFG